MNGSPGRLQLASTNRPRTLEQTGLTPKDAACAHVVAFDRLQNATAEQVACAGPLAPPPVPAWKAVETQVVANPRVQGLVGLDSWFWLAPAPAPMTMHETYRGIDYALTAVPTGASWDFGDGDTAQYSDSSGYGNLYPQPSSVTHTYEAHEQAGNRVRSAVQYEVTWTASIEGRRLGP